MDGRDSDAAGALPRRMTPSEVRRESASREADAHLAAFMKETNTRKLAGLPAGAAPLPPAGAPVLGRRGSAGMARVRSTEATPEEHVLSPPHTGSASEVSLTGRTPPTMLVEGQPSESSDEGSAFQRVLLPPHHAGSAGGTDHPPVFADSHVLTHNYGNTKVTGGAAAGMLSVESLIGPPASPAIVGDLHTDACNDDLIFEYEVLKKKLIEETALSKQVQDKVHFLMLKVKAKDEQISNLRESLRRKTKMLHEKQEEEAAASTARDQLQRRVNSLEAAAMQLEYEKFQLQKPLDPTQRRTTETDEQVQQRGAEKAKLLVAHKLLQKTSDKEIDRLKALNRQQRTDFRRRLQRLEQNCMEFEDEYNAGSLHTLMNTVKYGRYQQQRDARAAIARELRFGERVSFSAPDDAHVKALLDRSNYSELLAACKSELGDPTKELKELLDRTLQSLWMLFNEKQRSPQLNQHNLQRPARRIYEDFYKAIEQTLYRSKQVVAEYARKSNSFAKAMVSREKEVTEQIRQTRYSTVDFECQTDFRPETPKEIYDLRGEVRLYQDRLKDLSVQAAEKEQSMEIRASKAESNLEYLQRRILTLHRSLFNTLHLVYKHRYRWIPRLPDPMRQLRIPEAKDRQKALEVSFNMKIGELLEHDHKYMEAFGNYMVSDEFGTNAVGNTPGQTAQKRRRSSLQPEAAAPVASSDTDGDDDGGAKEGRKKGSSSAHPPPLPGKPRSVAHGALDGGYSTLPAGERCGEDGVLRRVASQQLHKGKEAEEEAPRSIPERPLGAMGRANTMSKLPKAPPQPAPAPPRSDSIRTRRTSSSLEGDSPSPPLGRVVSQQQLGDVTAATATTSPPAPLPSFAQPIGRVKKRASLPDASPATGCYVTTTAGAPGLAPAQDCSKDALMGNLQIRKADTGRIMQSRTASAGGMPFSSSWAATPPPPGSQERASVDRQFSVGGAKFSPEVKASLDVIHKYIRGEPLLQQGGGGSLFDDLPMAAQPDGLPVAPAAQEKEAPPPSVQRHGSAVRKPFEFTPQSSPVSAPGSCRRTHPGRAPAARPLPSQTFAAVDPSCTFKSISPHRRSEDLAPQGQGQATRHEGLHDASTAAPPPSAHVTPQAVPVRDAPSAAPYYPPLSDAAPPLAPRLSSVPSAAPAGDVFDSKNVVQPPMQSGPPMPSNPPSAASTGAPAAGPRYRTLTLMEVVNFLRWHYSTDKDAEARLLENGDGLDTLEEDEVVALTECLTEDLIQLKHAGGGAAAVVAPPSDAAPTSSIPVRNTRTPSREPEFAAAPAAAAAATAPNSLAAPSPRSDAPQEPIVRRHLRGERVVVDTTSAPHQASSPAVSSVAPVPALAAPVDPSPPTVPLTGPTATGSETAQDPPSVPVSHTASMMSTGAARDGDGGEQFLSSTLAAAAAVGEQDELVMSVAEPSPEPCPAAAPPAPVAVDDDDDDHDLVSNETSERYSMSRSPSPVPHENLAQPRVLQQAHHVQPSGAAAVKGQGGRPQVSTAHIPQQPQPSERLSASIKNPPTPPAHPAAPVKIPSVHPTQSASSTPQPQQPTPDRRPPQSARPPVAAPQPAQPHSQLENAPPPRTQTPPAPAMLKAPHSAPRPSTPQQPPLPQTPTGQPMSVPPGTPRTVAALAAVRQEIAYLHPKLGALHVLKYNATSSGRGPRWLGIDITESGLNLVVAKGHSLLAQPNSNRKAHKLESLVGVVTGAHNPNLLEDKAWAKHRASGRALKGPAVKGLASGERLSPEGCFTLRFGGSALGGERKAFNFYSSDAKLHLWVTFFSLMVQFNTQQANAQAQAQAQAQAKG